MGVGGGGVGVYNTNQFQTTSVLGGRGGEGERWLLAPVLFCTPANLMLKNIINFIML
jgi:hypothetical protein